MLRTFVALTLESNERGQVIRLQHELDCRLSASTGPLRPTRPEQLHITIAFLGDTHPDDVPMLSAALEQVSERHQPFALSGQRLLFLPKARRAQVVALGLDDPRGEASNLAADIMDRLTPLNFQFERRQFLPHLTLFRSRMPFACSEQFLRAFPDESLRVVLRLGQLAFYASRLEPSGARHELLSASPLGAPSS